MSAVDERHAAHRAGLGSSQLLRYDAWFDQHENNAPVVSSPLFRGLDRELPALNTHVNGDALLGSGISQKPLSDVFVIINGVDSGRVSYGDKTGVFFFSNDNGATSALWSEIVPGSTVHVNPTLLGFLTTTGDVVTLMYQS